MQTAAALVIIGLFMAIPLVMGEIARRRSMPTTRCGIGIWACDRRG